jgi:hypothetical protein
VQITGGPIPVHVTGGPSTWDYVVGFSTILAVVGAAVALLYAAKAGSDLVNDRRQTFELSLLLHIYEKVEGGMPLTGTQDVAYRVRLIPEDELPALNEWMFHRRDVTSDLDDQTEKINAEIKYRARLVERAKIELGQAIGQRTR